MQTRFSEAFTPASGEQIVVSDPRELDVSSTLRHRLPSDLAVVRYLLHDRRLLRDRFTTPISTHSRVHAEGIYVTRIVDRFQTEMEIGGAGLDRFWFAMANTGSMLVQQSGASQVGGGSAGVALRGQPGTSLLSSDGNVRTNVWIEANAVETALSAMLDDELRRPLVFDRAIDWSTGLAVSLRGQVELFVVELRRHDGLASNPLALALFKDLFMRIMLHGLRHNYSERLAPRPAAPAPVYLHRAESFMHAHADRPLRMHDVAAAAGCSVRTLNDVYLHFRDTTPLNALRIIRLNQLRAALYSGGDLTFAALARRYGFSNTTRLAKAYSRQFRESPSETIHRKGLRADARIADEVGRLNKKR
jgi:AraC-like DNA-binding protein